MKRVQVALAAFAAVAGIGSAFTTNHTTSKKVADTLYWYQPGSNVTITATAATAKDNCPTVTNRPCLKGHAQRLSTNPASPTIQTLTGAFQ